MRSPECTRNVEADSSFAKTWRICLLFRARDLPKGYVGANLAGYHQPTLAARSGWLQLQPRIDINVASKQRLDSHGLFLSARQGVRWTFCARFGAKEGRCTVASLLFTSIATVILTISSWYTPIVPAFVFLPRSADPVILRYR